MNPKTMNRAQLLSTFEGLVKRDRDNTAELIRVMERVDALNLFAAEGYPSMFAFCVERFQMSEAQTNKRIRVARLARRFPTVTPMIRNGELHLSGLCILASHLTDENHLEVLRRAKGLSMRQTEKLAVELRPLPDVPSQVRKLPAPRKTKECTENRAEETLSLVPERALVRPLAAQAQLPRTPRAKDPEPLSPKRFKLTVTISEETNDTLEKLQQLMSHQLPGGDPAAIVEKALTLLLENKLKEKAAQVARPRESPSSKCGPRPRSRAIPASVKREVWERDEGQCCFNVGAGRA